jgi:NAD(P)-dependent dehydrogenase (short-subunit alcohol dehydrogenase family)
MTSALTPVSQGREPELAGQIVVVIGGSVGVGLETARRARAEGADVNLTAAIPVGLRNQRVNSALGTAGGAATTCHPGRHRGFERSPDGLLAAARVYDNVNAPVNPS